MKILDNISNIFKKSFTQKFLASIVSQGLISLTNFFIGIAIARMATKGDYGVYVLAFSIIMIATSVQNALINSPLTVLFPAKSIEQREQFVSGLAWGQWFIFMPLLIAGIIIANIFYDNPTHSVLFNAILALSIVLPLALGREFLRVVHYCHLQIRSVFKMDIIFVLFALITLSLLYYFSKINAMGALAVLGTGFLFSAAKGTLTFYRKHRFNIKWLKSSLKESWIFSRWALLGVAATNLQTYGYVFLISLTHSLESTAVVAAARLLLMPFGLILSSSQRIFLSKGAHILHSEGRGKFYKFMVVFILLFVAGWAIWTTAIVIFQKQIIKVVFTDKYLEISKYFIIWAVFFLINAVRFIISNSLQILKEFKPLAIFGTYSSIIFLLSSFALLEKYGVAGILYSQVIAEAVLLITVTFQILRHHKLIFFNKPWLIKVKEISS